VFGFENLFVGRFSVARPSRPIARRIDDLRRLVYSASADDLVSSPIAILAIR